MSRIIGPYAIQGLLGSGGIGHVYAALDQNLGRPVALKMLRQEFSEDPDSLERFRNEAANLARLNHPNITTLYSLYRDTSSQRQIVFMVMEMVNGETLEAILARTGRFNTRGCLAVMAQAVAGLSYAHSVGIIHRDIKPSNMMLNDAGLLKITDFGIARAQGSQRLTRHGAVVGTLSYIAPEQIKGQESDERSDLYSLACLLYELLSGRKPFAGLTEYELIRAQLEVQPEPLSASIPDLQPSIDQAVRRALAKNPADRFASVNEFAEALGTASVQDAAVTIVKQQVLFNVPPLCPSASDEPLFLDPYEGSPDPPLAAQMSAEPALAQTSGWGRRGRVATAAAAGVVAIAAGGAYLAAMIYPGSDTIVVPRARAPAGLAAIQTGQPKPSGNSAVAQAMPSKPQGGAAVSKADPRVPPANPTVAPTEAGPHREPATSQVISPVPGGGEAARQAQPSAPSGNPLARPGPAGRNSAAPQSPASASPQPLQAAAAPVDASKQVSVRQLPNPDGLPATGATDVKTIAGQISSYSDDGWPIIGGVTLHLSGVGPLASGEASHVSGWIANHGNYLACEALVSDRYRCLTAQNFDLAQAILLNGAARASADAAPTYREAEAHARTAKRGVWR